MTDPTTDPTTFTQLSTVTSETAPVNDTWTVRIVVLLLGLIASAVIVGSIILAAMGKAALPGEITTIGATAAGALGGLLASTASRRT